MREDVGSARSLPPFQAFRPSLSPPLPPPFPFFFLFSKRIKNEMRMSGSRYPSPGSFFYLVVSLLLSPVFFFFFFFFPLSRR